MLLGNLTFIQPLMIGSSELLVIAAIILLLFGGKQIPELMRNMGQGMKYFKKGMNEDIPDNEENTNEVLLPKEEDPSEIKQ